jgi:hypothetical protein
VLNQSLEVLRYQLLKLRPKPNIWDVNIVLEFLKQLGINDKLTLRQFFLKSSTLMALQTAELASLSRTMQRFKNGWIFHLNKSKRIQRFKNNLEVQVSFFQDPTLCPLRCLKFYLGKTTSLTSSTESLFLTLNKPLWAPSGARHRKSVLEQAGIDSKVVTAHSFRSGSTSKALVKGVSISKILERDAGAKESAF